MKRSVGHSTAYINTPRASPSCQVVHTNTNNLPVNLISFFVFFNQFIFICGRVLWLYLNSHTQTHVLNIIETPNAKDNCGGLFMALNLSGPPFSHLCTEDNTCWFARFVKNPPTRSTRIIISSLVYHLTLFFMDCTREEAYWERGKVGGVTAHCLLTVLSFHWIYLLLAFICRLEQWMGFILSFVCHRFPQSKMQKNGDSTEDEEIFLEDNYKAVKMIMS